MLDQAGQLLEPKLVLVDRREQIDKFNDILSRIHNRRPVSENIFEWYGGPGIGKSMLIELLVRECENKHIPWILTNFKDLGKRTEKYLDDPTKLIEDLVSNLAKKAPLNTTSLRESIKKYRSSAHPKQTIRAYFNLSQEERLYQKPDWLERLRSLTVEFIKLVDGLAPKSDRDPVQPVVFLFDETEHADVELVDWLEEWVINPLAQRKYCVIVWMARRPWRWKRPEIRRRLQSEPLLVFAEEEVKEQVRFNSSNPDLAELFFKNVHIVTGGHPFANSVVISQFDAWEAQGQTLTPEYFSAREIELLREIFHRFIRDYAFERLTSREKLACELLAMVRLFDTTMLRAILTMSSSEEFAGWSQEDFGDLLLLLQKTQLLVWDRGYTLDPALRYIIRNYFSVCEISTFVEVNRAALAVYQNWLEKPVVDNRSLFVIEELYHYASLQQVGEPVSLEDELAKRLRQYPKWIKDDQALGNALERLEGELKHDKELERLTERVSSTKLVEQVREFLTPIANKS